MCKWKSSKRVMGNKFTGRKIQLLTSEEDDLHWYTASEGVDICIILIKRRSTIMEEKNVLKKRKWKISQKPTKPWFPSLDKRNKQSRVIITQKQAHCWLLERNFFKQNRESDPIYVYENVNIILLSIKPCISWE